MHAATPPTAYTPDSVVRPLASHSTPSATASPLPSSQPMAGTEPTAWSTTSASSSSPERPFEPHETDGEGRRAVALTVHLRQTAVRVRDRRR